MTSNTSNNKAFEELFTATAQTTFNLTPRDWQRRVGGQILAGRKARGGLRQLCV